MEDPGIVVEAGFKVVVSMGVLVEIGAGVLVGSAVSRALGAGVVTMLLVAIAVSAKYSMQTYVKEKVCFHEERRERETLIIRYYQD